MNRRSSTTSRLLHNLSGILSIAPSSLIRRDLDFPSQSEVQLELEFFSMEKSRNPQAKTQYYWDRLDMAI